jgi:hypothetical protein
MLLGLGFLAGFALSRCQLGHLSDTHLSSERPNPIVGGQIRWSEAPTYLKNTVHREARWAQEQVGEIGDRFGADLRLSYRAEEGYGYHHPNLTMSTLKIPVTLTNEDEVQGIGRPLLDILEDAKTEGYLLESTDGHSQETKLVIGGTLWLWRVNTGNGWRKLESDVDRTLTGVPENQRRP